VFIYQRVYDVILIFQVQVFSVSLIAGASPGSRLRHDLLCFLYKLMFLKWLSFAIVIILGQIPCHRYSKSGYSANKLLNAISIQKWCSCFFHGGFKNRTIVTWLPEPKNTCINPQQWISRSMDCGPKRWVGKTPLKRVINQQSFWTPLEKKILANKHLHSTHKATKTPGMPLRLLLFGLLSTHGNADPKKFSQET